MVAMVFNNPYHSIQRFFGLFSATHCFRSSYRFSITRKANGSLFGMLCHSGCPIRDLQRSFRTFKGNYRAQQCLTLHSSGASPANFKR